MSAPGSAQAGAPGGAPGMVAVLARKGRFMVAEPFFAPDAAASGGPRARESRQLVVAPARGRGAVHARAGDLVLLGAPRAGRGGPARAQVARVIGRPDVPRDVIEALMLDRGLHRRFGASVEREATEVGGAIAAAGVADAARAPGAGGRGRLDLRDMPTFTVDPATARDYDDAISAEHLEGQRVRVWVHIADVSAFVREGSALDREARRRGTSVYVPGAVEPMLPEALSNGACSLVPDQDRLTVTVEMDIEDGRTVRTAFHRSLIRSDARLSYEQVDRIFAGLQAAAAPWGAGLAAARLAAAGLATARRRAGALEIGSAEPEFAFAPDGAVEVKMPDRPGAGVSESHEMIEQLMIAANEAVARHLADRSVPCLYRVHERPDPDRVLRLVDQLASLAVPTPPVPEPMSGSQAAELVAEISVSLARHFAQAEARVAGRHGGDNADSPIDEGAPADDDWSAGPVGRRALEGLVLRTLQQAYYSPANIGHAGLGSEAYCHFTSPIRRYPDIVCHRALLSTLGAAEHPADAAGLGELGAWTSEREREAMAIERAATDVASCFALEALLHEHGWSVPFAGEITGLIGGGAFVAFDVQSPDGSGAVSRSPAFEGMIPVRRLRHIAAGAAAASTPRRPGAKAGRRQERERSAAQTRDWWELNEEGTMLVGSDSGRVLRLGESVAVRVVRVEAPRGRVELAPAPDA